MVPKSPDDDGHRVIFGHGELPTVVPPGGAKEHVETNEFGAAF